MKTVIAFLFTTAMISPLLIAQDQEPLPGQEPQTQLEKPITLMPDNVPSVDKPPSAEKTGQTAEEKLASSKTVKSEQDLKQRVRYREVKTMLMKNAALQEKRELVANAKTDPEKRDALRDYYQLLHDKIVATDASLKELADHRKSASISRLSQSRIEQPGVNDEQEAAERAAAAER